MSTQANKPASNCDDGQQDKFIKVFSALITGSEDWLMDQILAYAKTYGYTKYTSTLKEAWRQSISGLSKPLLTAIQIGEKNLELGPEEDFAKDPIASFGIHEAKLHRERGVDLGMFLGLMKYYRASYLDLVRQTEFSKESKAQCCRIVELFFDRVELGFSVEWSVISDKDRIKEMQARNRRTTNEKNKYLTVFESIKDPAILLNDKSRIDTVNHAWTEMFVSSALPGADYYGDKHVKQHIPWLAKELLDWQSGQQQERSFEKQLETRLGMRHFQIKFKRMLDISDKYSGAVVLFHDVTELKQAEDALRETMLWLKSTFNALEEAVFITTRDRKLVDVNKAAEQIFGYTRAEFADLPVEALHVDQDHYEEFRKRALKAFKKDHTVTFEFEAKRKDGQIFPTEHTVSLLKNDQGQALGVLSVLRDISERKQAEKMLLDSERLQGVLEMAGAVCHEMNQPLMAVAGYSELLELDLKPDDPLTAKIAKVRKNIDKLGKITQHLMRITRYETKAYLDSTIIDIQKSSDKSEDKQKIWDAFTSKSKGEAKNDQ
ncbi:PAS domain S-box protein [Thermodesulfobacteriota bacterium]